LMPRGRGGRGGDRSSFGSQRGRDPGPFRHHLCARTVPLRKIENQRCAKRPQTVRTRSTSPDETIP
jgi:hypothetical protein